MNPDDYDRIIQLSEAHRRLMDNDDVQYVIAPRRHGKSITSLWWMAEQYGFLQEDTDHFKDNEELFEI